MPSPRVAFKTIPLALALACITACAGGEDRPSSERDGTARLVTEGTTQGKDGQVCEPGASEVCFLTVTNVDGSVSCPESIRFCRADGSRWHDCGHYDVTPDGRAVPPSESTLAPPQPE